MNSWNAYISTHIPLNSKFLYHRYVEILIGSNTDRYIELTMAYIFTGYKSFHKPGQAVPAFTGPPAVQGNISVK